MSIILSEIAAAKYLLKWERNLGPVCNWKQNTLNIWFDKYDERRKRLAHDMTMISDNDCDYPVTRDDIQYVIDRLDECMKTYSAYKITKKDKPLKKDKKQSHEDIICDRLYEVIQNDIKELRFSTINDVQRKIDKWERKLDDTTNVTQRQMIKEGLNDFRAYLDYCIEELRRSKKRMEDAVYMLSFYNMDDYEKGIYARVNFSLSSSNRIRTTDGDEMMFFGNGDVVVL